jgi:uncharacterized protein (TIGR02391 family)
VHVSELTPEEVVALPLDELALRVLADAKSKETWNWKNWMIEAQNSFQRDLSALRALSEAWTWLRSKGLVAWNPAQDSDNSVFITRRGHLVLKSGLAFLRATERLDVELHPALENKVRPQFLRGDFETAIFVAMKEVEVRVRQLSKASDSLLGTKLMQHAFAPGGPLANSQGDPGEVVAEMELFKGAIGLFKNPSSHRPVDYADATVAAEIVLLADLLLRLLDRRNAER